MKKSWATAMILSILEPWDTFPAKYAIKQYTLSAFQIEYIWRINIGIVPVPLCLKPIRGCCTKIL